MRREAKTRAAAIGAWLPFGLLSLIVLALGGRLLAGGQYGALAWYQLVYFLPLLAVAFVVLGLIRIAWIRRITPAIAATVGLGLVAAVPGTWALRIWPMEFPVALADTQPTLEIRVPADAPMKVLWGGDSALHNYHALFSDQRWAYDLAIAPYLAGTSSLEDYGCFGVPVVAPVSGRVVAAVDGEPDEIPGRISNNFSAPAGNHVVLSPAQGGYVLIAHLKQGSVSVSPGDRVAEGDAIGACGNSGNTSEPHIHIHYQRQHPEDVEILFGAEGLPLFFRDHGGPAMPLGGMARGPDGEMQASGETIQHGKSARGAADGS